jgi:hypothetical protein
LLVDVSLTVHKHFNTNSQILIIIFSTVTYFTGEAITQAITRAKRSPTTPKRVNLTKVNMPQPTQAQSYNQEGRILLAIQLIKEGHIQSIRASVMSYDVPYTTLYNWLNGKAS